MNIRVLFSLLLCFCCFCVCWKHKRKESLVLWYNEPSENWNEALPIGNGRAGAMVFGGVDKEQLQLNENTLIAGNLRLSLKISKLPPRCSIRW